MHSETKSFSGSCLLYALNLKHNATSFYNCNPILHVTFTFTHTNTNRLTCYWFVRENLNVYFTATLLCNES